MRLHLRKTFLSGTAALVFFAAAGLAANHHSLNGTWKLISGRSDFAGGTMLQSASITINDREHNISISRNFTSEGENTTSSYTFDTDAPPFDKVQASRAKPSGTATSSRSRPPGPTASRWSAIACSPVVR
jgi:hypothetical protein